MVTANIHILYSVRIHNNYIWSGTSSKHILDEAAAMAMHDCKYDAVKVLADLIQFGWLKHGPALTAQLLLITAHDRAVRKQFKGSNHWLTWNKIYSIAVPLLDFLDALFAN
ncbi:uncharacterized protein PHACADRAFT_200185 [Phanerochaete carnosa HHB-10118-sp]|uniref:Uncharacterized protein n=1 Tax=Phanerochaete carnosa (strain HHB-10118-sp) TaxID=650164 RepID=K5VXP6_PHACS|nr:uncharacterized protein PHACADRAFT_200185 [Phanerochaete carnosa HHB-10118-sp]EKM51364.1 hypothetical protein PHACADRAFT_200185 [Phanerochaete carnosa HHB-10118-sp]